MIKRRESARNKVIKEIGERGAAVDWIGRNVSSKVGQLPKNDFVRTVAQKGSFFLARIIWWRDNFIGVAFRSDSSSDAPVSDLAERLRKSEIKKRQLQRRIDELIGDR